MVRKLIFEVCANCGEKIVDDEVAIVVDEHNDLIFCNESCVHEYFQGEIDKLETEHLKLRTPDDISVQKFSQYERFLPLLLEEPDEIWECEGKEDEAPVWFYIGEFFSENEPVYYVAATYRSNDMATFVYLHFPTRKLELVEKFRKGEIIFDGAQETEIKLSEDDEITDGNIAIELYSEMIENRLDVDIDPEDFSSYSEYKLRTVEKPDEIWKRIDETGNTFMVYIGHYQKEAETIAYVVVAIEDELAGGAIPIFGFPTIDQKLLDRFRVGELIFKVEESF